MNLYDFDGTIYNGDSGIDFIKYSFIRKPFLVFRYVLKTAFKFFKYKSGKCEFKEVKESMFAYVTKINNLESFVKKFVKKNRHKIKKFYFEQRQKSDIIITASLDFYVKPLCHSVGIKRVIATKYDPNTGRIIGNNCKGQAKEKVLLNRFKTVRFNSVYTDSIDDTVLFKYSDNNYIINKNKIEKYNEEYQFKKKIFDVDFLIFVFCGGMGTLSNFVCSSIISLKLNPVVAYVCGYSISLIVSYLLNIKYVFKRKIKITDFIKFAISYIPNFLILFSFVYVFINILDINKYITYLLSAIVGLPVTFLILKLLTFKKSSK